MNLFCFMTSALFKTAVWSRVSSNWKCVLRDINQVFVLIFVLASEVYRHNEKKTDSPHFCKLSKYRDRLKYEMFCPFASYTLSKTQKVRKWDNNSISLDERSMWKVHSIAKTYIKSIVVRVHWPEMRACIGCCTISSLYRKIFEALRQYLLIAKVMKML